MQDFKVGDEVTRIKCANGFLAKVGTTAKVIGVTDDYVVVEYPGCGHVIGSCVEELSEFRGTIGEAWLKQYAEVTRRRMEVGGVTTARREVVFSPNRLSLESSIAEVGDENSLHTLKEALPADSTERKTYPLYSGLFRYFPSALAAVAHHSYLGNEKHNPGLPMQHARGKSNDHLDALLRHVMEGDLEGAAWRALAALQQKLEDEGHAVAPAATFPEK